MCIVWSCWILLIWKCLKYLLHFLCIFKHLSWKGEGRYTTWLYDFKSLHIFTESHDQCFKLFKLLLNNTVDTLRKTGTANYLLGFTPPSLSLCLYTQLRLLHFGVWSDAAPLHGSKLGLVAPHHVLVAPALLAQLGHLGPQRRVLALQERRSHGDLVLL